MARRSRYRCDVCCRVLHQGSSGLTHRAELLLLPVPYWMRSELKGAPLASSKENPLSSPLGALESELKRGKWRQLRASIVRALLIRVKTMIM